MPIMSMTTQTEAAPDPRYPQFKMHHRLALVMENANIDAEQMAEALGVHKNTIYNYMRGDRAPKRAAIKEWAMRCGVPELWAWIETGETGNPGPDQGSPLSRWTAKPAADQDVIRHIRRIPLPDILKSVA